MIIRLNASEIKGHSGRLNISHTRKITFEKVTCEILSYFEKECIAFLVYVDQEDAETLDVEISDSVSLISPTIFLFHKLMNL